MGGGGGGSGGSSSGRPRQHRAEKPTLLQSVLSMWGTVVDSGADVRRPAACPPLQCALMSLSLPVDMLARCILDAV